MCGGRFLNFLLPRPQLRPIHRETVLSATGNEAAALSSQQGEDSATSALRQATVGLNSMVERLRDRINALEDQLDRARRSQTMAEEMRSALEAEAQEVRPSVRHVLHSRSKNSFIRSPRE